MRAISTHIEHPNFYLICLQAMITVSWRAYVDCQCRHLGKLDGQSIVSPACKANTRKYTTSRATT